MTEVSWFKHYYIAHRGLHNHEIDENSYEAFARAIEHNLAIECDVHLTKDNVVIIHHDKETGRLTNKNLMIEKTSFSDLKALHHKNSKFPIMSLEELLDLVKGKVPLLLEIKYDKKRGRLLDQKVAALIQNYKGDAAVQSFDPFSCYWFYKNYPQIKRGLLLDDEYEGVTSPFTRFFLKYALMLPFCAPDFIALNWQRNDDPLIRLLRNLNKYFFIAWTVRSKSALLACKDSFDTIIFDYIETIS